ncbi:MAG: hypothetical protein ACMXYG_06860 [Candidatus Woesearchaeota archaeon]
MKFYIVKIREWGLRYIPAEIICTLFSIFIAIITFKTTNNAVITAFAAAWSETIAYYTVIIIKDLWREKINFKTINNQAKNMLIEFGFSEFLDSFLIRPFFMYLFPLITKNLAIGIIIGKIISDILFYVPTIIFYEWNKKRNNKKSENINIKNYKQK